MKVKLVKRGLRLFGAGATLVLAAGIISIATDEHDFGANPATFLSGTGVVLLIAALLVLRKADSLFS